MLSQYIILSLVLFFAVLVPPVLSPMGYSLTGLMLLQNANPRTLLIVSVIVVTLSDIVTWIVQNKVIKGIDRYEKLENPNRFQRVVNRINRYFKEQSSLKKIGSRRERYAQTTTGKVATFLFAIFCYLPFIADIISTRLLYKKIKFPYFVIAVVIGKTISHGVFIFAGQSILQFLHLVK